MGFLSVWFDDPRNLATAVGLATAGLAFALQRVVTAVAGYVVILRGKTFDVGDRIVMGGVRGDVIALGFIQTTIFSEPVYNYSREFPLVWEEMDLPIAYGDDREKAEQILLEVAEKHTAELHARGEAAIQSMMRRYAMAPAELAPKVFYRITDNWLELGLRFVAPAHGARELKDAMSRDILRAFDASGIGIASATYDIVGMPPLRTATSEPISPEQK